MALRTAVFLCGLGTLAAAAQETYRVEELTIRPYAEDYAPVLLDSHLVVCSHRERSDLVEYTDAETGEALSDLYLVRMRGGEAQKPELFSTNLASPVHDGPATFRPDGDAICYTRNLVLPEKVGNLYEPDGRVGLFFSKRIGNEWSTPEPFPYNHEGYSVMHASWSPDGNTLYFASDMPGGFGGTDLYMCEREGSDWSLPLNLGAAVNSTADELFPSAQTNGRLYFCTNRGGGLGKLDIWWSKHTGEGWDTPQHLPAPMNSAKNDVGYTAYHGDHQGFFSSDREGKQRIYAFRLVREPFADCQPQVPNTHCYAFAEPNSISGARLPLYYQWDLGDGTKHIGHEVRHCYTNAGLYQVRLDLVDSASGQTFFALAQYELRVEDRQQAWIDVPDTIAAGTSAWLSAERTYLPQLPVAEYHWQVSDADHYHGDRTQVKFARPGARQIKLDVIGRPDADGKIAHHCVTRLLNVLPEFTDTPDPPIEHAYAEAKQLARMVAYHELPYLQSTLGTQNANEDLAVVLVLSSRRRMGIDAPEFLELRKQHDLVEHYAPERGEYTYSVVVKNDLETAYRVFVQAQQLRFMEAQFQSLDMEDLVDLSGDVDMTILLASSKQRLANDDARLVEIRKHFSVLQRYDPETRMYTYLVPTNGTSKEMDRVLVMARELGFMEAMVNVLQQEHVVDLAGTANEHLVLTASMQRIAAEDPRLIEMRRHVRVMERYDPKTRLYTYSVARGASTEELARIVALARELDFLNGDERVMAELDAHDAGELQGSVLLAATRKRLAADDPRLLDMRRVYRVVERHDPRTGVYTYLVPSAGTMDEMQRIVLLARNMDFMEPEIYALTPLQLLDADTLGAEIIGIMNRSIMRAGTVLFGKNDDALSPEFTSALGQMLDVLRKHVGVHLQIDAHTDSDGTDAHNDDLSARRAARIHEWFLASGVDPERMVHIGHGEHEPVASNANEEGKRLNRRVDLRLHANAPEQANATR
jgi:outer membrane protein OmpA-like peptidoglycan-associated protein